MTSKKMGGFAYFISIPALILIDAGLMTHLIKSVSDFFNELTLWFIGGASIGVCLSPLFSSGRLHVFMHETKHAIAASLAGNKWKRMNVEGESGSYEYSYTKRTAHLNAFIALAPYWLPLLTFPMAFLALAIRSPEGARLLIGATCCIDLICGVKDLGPHQSDLRNIRGGTLLASSYVLLMNLMIAAVTATWASSGFQGLKGIAWGLFVFFKRLIFN